ncbi:MAG: AMP-binding protein [Acidilobaceae archaeon]
MYRRVADNLRSSDLIIPPSMKWKSISLGDYRRIYESSISNFIDFWVREALKLKWSKLWATPLEGSPPRSIWFKDGSLSPYYNLIGKHRDTWIWSKLALIWEGEDGLVKALTYEDLDNTTFRLSGSLKAMGVESNDWIIFYAPPLIEVITLMIASIRIAATFEPVFTGFSFWELANRISNRGPKLIVTVDGFYRRGRVVDTLTNVRRALEKIKYNCNVIVIERIGSRKLTVNEVSFDDIVKYSNRGVEDSIVKSQHPLFGLHTAYEDKFKPITHSTGGYLTQVYATSRWIGLRPHDTYYCTVWPGWITGVSYVVFGPLMIGSTILLYEGGPDWPSWDRWWDLIERYAVTIFLATGGALRLLSKQDSSHVRDHNIDTLKLILVTAEPLEASTWRWAYSVIGTSYAPLIDSIPDKLTGRIPVVNMYIQSELGTFITGNLVNYTFPPLKPGSVGPPIPGFNIDVINDSSISVRESIGRLIIKSPWPAMPIEFPEDYESLWSRGFYDTGDYAVMDSDGYIYVLGRRDTVMKVSGYRLSPGAIEEVIESNLHKQTLVVGLYDDLRFESPLVIVEGQVNTDDVKRIVRDYIGPIADPKLVLTIKRMPNIQKHILRRMLKEALWSSEGSLEVVENILREFLNS